MLTTESLFFYRDEWCIDVLLCWLFNSMLVHNMLISRMLDSDKPMNFMILDNQFRLLCSGVYNSRWKNNTALWNSRICLQCRRLGFDPWVGKFLWRREWQSTAVFLPGEFHGQRSLAGYSLPYRRVGHDWVTNPRAHTRPKPHHACSLCQDFLPS